MSTRRGFVGALASVLAGVFAFRVGSWFADTGPINMDEVIADYDTQTSAADWWEDVQVGDVSAGGMLSEFGYETIPHVVVDENVPEWARGPTRLAYWRSAVTR
jgi:hypothetical protein